MDSPPLTIGLMSPALPETGAINGIVTYVRYMRDALRRLGHSVIVAAGNQIERADGSVATIPKPNLVINAGRLFIESRRQDDGSSAWVRLAILEAFRAVRMAGAQVIEMEETYGWAGRLVGGGPAIVERLHGPHVFGRDEIETAEQKRVGDLREAAELESFGNVQALTSPSRKLLEALISRYSLALPLARAIPNPIEVVPAADTWSVECTTPDQILCVGRFDLRKGADVVVRAFAAALERQPALSLVMVGPDAGLMQGNGSRRHFDDFVTGELAPEARARIRFLGPQSSQVIQQLRLESAFAIVGSRFENFPYSISEALAVGMPVLASDSFGNAELVRDGIDGRIVPVGDVAATANAIVAMATNPAELAQMGRSAYARAAEWLSPDRIARETVTVYREAIARR